MYREDEVIEALRAAASAGGANPARIKKRHAVMNEITGKYCLGGFYPTLDYILSLVMLRWSMTHRIVIP